MLTKLLKFWNKTAIKKIPLITIFIFNTVSAGDICKLSDTPFGQLIKNHESWGGKYGAYNKNGGKSNGVDNSLTEKTVGEVMQAQAKGEYYAVGAYQIIPDTLKASVINLGIDKNAKFDKTMQDFIFNEYLTKGKRKLIKNYFYGNGSIDSGALATAMEWASMPIKAGTVNNKKVVATSNCGWSYYSNGIDKSRMCYETLINAMEVSKKQLESNECNPSEDINKDEVGHKNDKDNPFDKGDTDYNDKDGGGRINNSCGGCIDYGVAQRLGKTSNRKFDILDLETLREIEKIAIKINKAHQILEVESKNILIQNQKLLELQAEVKGNIAYNQRVILELQSIIDSIGSEESFR